MAGAVAHDRISEMRAASQEDDAAIRKLLRENAMRGSISISLEREPDYFRGCGIGEAEDETILVCEDDRPVCVGRCSYRDCWWQGEVVRSGYLAELRLDKSARGRFDLIKRGYRYFHQRSEARKVDLYFTSITSDNTRAIRFLESQSRGLPRYRFLAEYTTVLVSIPRGPNRPKMPVERSSSTGEIAAFLSLSNKKCNLSPVWTSERIDSLEKHGVEAEDFFMIRENGKILACGAIWDQRAFRQTKIICYSGFLNAARPLINFWAGIREMPGLPNVDTILKHGFLSPSGFAPGCESLLPDFVEAILPYAEVMGLEFLTLGLPSGDERLRQLQRRFGARIYSSRIYEVSWGEYAGHSGIIFPEIGLL